MRIKPTKYSGFKEKLVTVKVTMKEWELIKDKANLYAAGNMSEWVRYSSTKLLPRARDILNADD